MVGVRDSLFKAVRRLGDIYGVLDDALSDVYDAFVDAEDEELKTAIADLLDEFVNVKRATDDLVAKIRSVAESVGV